MFSCLFIYVNEFKVYFFYFFFLFEIVFCLPQIFLSISLLLLNLIRSQRFFFVFVTFVVFGVDLRSLQKKKKKTGIELKL